MRIALLADVHANLPALEAVLDDVARTRVDRVVVLGDIVGYGAHPAECIALIRALDAVVVAGNHDRDVLHASAASGTSAPARLAQVWTRGQLDRAALDWLTSLPGRIDVERELAAVHGCFLNEEHTWGYVTSTMLEANLVRLASAGGPRIGANGHTHAALVGWLQRGRCGEANPKEHTELVHIPECEAVLVNPGSVGQPRDRDPRASWGVLDTAARTLEIRRCRYDVERAAAAIRAAGLPESLAARLSEGI